MSEQTPTAEKKKAPQKPKKQLGISALAIVDNLIFTDKEVWAYYKITNRAYDFLSNDGKQIVMKSIANAFDNIMSDRKEAVEGHMIITSVPIDLDQWKDQITTISQDWSRSPGFGKYMNDVMRFLEDKDYAEKVVYIGFNLGKRGALNLEGLNPFNEGVKGAFETLTKWGQKMLMIPTEDIPEDEEKIYRQREEDLHTRLSLGQLQAKRPTNEELLLLMKRQFYPAMPTPYLDVDHEERVGPGDIAMETVHVMENAYRHLYMEQIIDGHRYEGYRATLSMTKFPREMFFPAAMPFLYFTHRIGVPCTMYSRFKLLPNTEVKKRHEKKVKEDIDQVQNAAAGFDETRAAVSGTPDHIRESIEMGQELGSELNQNKGAWFEGSFFIVLETPTLEYLNKWFTGIKDAYAELGINVTLNSGCQAELFLSQMPGDRARLTHFDQVATINMLAASGFNFASDVGDPVFGTTGGSEI